MAQSNHIKPEIAELIRASDAARARLSTAGIELQRKFDVRSRIGSFVKDHSVSLIGGSMLTGLAASFLLRPRKRSLQTSRFKRRGLLATLFVFLLGATKPFAKIYLTNLLKDYLANQLKSSSTNRNPQRNLFPNPSIHS